MTFPFTLIFMFLVFWRPQEWLVPALYGYPILDGIVYIAVLGLMMEYDRNRGARWTPAMWLVVGLWGATIVSHIAHTYFAGLMDTIPETFRFCFFTLLLLSVVNTIERVRAVVLVFIAGACLIAVHVLLQMKTGAGFAGQEPMMDFTEKKGWFPRGLFFGIFSDPNDTAQFMATAIPLVFAYPKRLSAMPFMICCGIAYLFLLAIDGTYSRGGLIALCAVAACLIFMRLPSKWLPYAGILALAGGLVLCLTYGAALMDISARERVVFWGLANWEFKHNPIFGIGYGMFWQVAGDRAAHNAFVSCYTELGLFGYWFWFSLIMLGMVGCWRVRVAFKRPRNGSQAYLKRLAGMSMAGMVGFLAAGYFLSRAFVFPLFFLMGLLNVIPLIAQRYLPEDSPPIFDYSKDIVRTGTFVTLFSVVYVYLSILALNKSYGG
jgi:hypothetical protein